MENEYNYLEEYEQDEAVDYSKLIEQSAFVGEYPYETIMEGIAEQFNDYINISDKTNYVDIFYNQLHKSYALLEFDNEEEHPQEIRTILDTIHERFVSSMKQLFEQRLTLTIMTIDKEETQYDEVEITIRRLYEFFILSGKDILKQVISKHINSSIKTIQDDREYYDTISELLRNYSPLITTMGPMEFLQLSKNQELYDLFDQGEVVGNFLRKFSPKLYQNEEFEVELIAHITMINEVKEELYGKQ